MKCSICLRLFRRAADKARHECTSERMKPVHEQRGSEQCGVCGSWFRSRVDLAVHRCVLQEELELQPSEQTTSRITAQTVECSVCGRGFNRSMDLKGINVKMRERSPYRSRREVFSLRDVTDSSKVRVALL